MRCAGDGKPRGRGEKGILVKQYGRLDILVAGCEVSRLTAVFHAAAAIREGKPSRLNMVRTHWPIQQPVRHRYPAHRCHGCMRRSNVQPVGWLNAVREKQWRNATIRLPFCAEAALWLRGSPFDERAMKTQGEIEAAVCDGISRFEQEYMGRGPKDIHTYLINDLLVVRLKGVLTAAEQQLVKSLPAEKGRDLLKQVRIHLIETARPVMEAMVEKATGVKVLSLHHDISTVTGEELVVFTLLESPLFRETRRT